MRVIAGKARSLNLKSLPSSEIRPTTDRIKETLFNILQPYLYGCRFLDLCSGSGAIGIEALSRGAACCILVDKNRRAMQILQENLHFTHLEENAYTMTTDAVDALQLLEGTDPFDIIFMDPPYGHGIERSVLEYLRNSALARSDTQIIVECDLQTSFDYLDALDFQIYRYKKYKTNAHVFISRKV